MQGPLSRSGSSPEHPLETDEPTRPTTSPTDPFGSAPVVELRPLDARRVPRGVSSPSPSKSSDTARGSREFERDGASRGASNGDDSRSAGSKRHALGGTTGSSARADAEPRDAAGSRNVAGANGDAPSNERAPNEREAGNERGAQVLVALRDRARAERLERDLLGLEGCARVRCAHPAQVHEQIDGRDHVVVLELDAPGDRNLIEELAARQADARLVILVERADHTLRAMLMDAGADHVLDGGTTGAEILASVGTHVRRLGRAVRGDARSDDSRAAVRTQGGPLPPRGSGEGSVQVGTAPERIEVEEGLVIDLGRMQIERGDRRLDLTPLEAGILGHVMHNSDRVVARDEILHVVWGGRESRACARTVDVHVVALRRKLHGGTSGSQRLLRTVRGLGYRWCG
jgi:DNA-binding response OmpR family regulator